jgi:serine/threonine protein kinase/Flp pilus assembly protein TadD
MQMSQIVGRDGPSASPHESIDRIMDDMAERWRRGDPLRVESYLELHPWLLGQPETVLELIAEEMNLRLEAGEEPQSEDFTRRFPLWERQVRALVQCHRLLVTRPTQVASAGESLGEFRLLKELGRGAQGRVFLATQHSLAERYVVLKLTPRLGDEHLSLSRLLHSHIVPLYAVYDFPERGLRCLCQPYYGGATLAELQPMLRGVPVGQRSGEDLVRALTGIEDARGVARPTTRGVCSHLIDCTYIEAFCWIAACLADALHHAHERGLLHLDLKPSNVLLAADGQPMLLDFHLAHPPLACGDPAPDRLGGTPGYMPSEQVGALAAAVAEQPVPAAVDRHADLYALGVVLYEMLADTLPPANAPGRSLRLRNSKVSSGLAAILERCLAVDALRRYPTAQELAEDLRRHLADLPLRGVANRSLPERWKKWRRRRPYLFPLLLLVAVSAGAGGNWCTQLTRDYRAGESAACEGEEWLQAGHHTEALNAFKHAGVLVDAVPMSAALCTRIRRGTEKAERHLIIDSLHALAEQLRPLDGMDGLSAERLAEAEQQCRQLWDNRALIAGCIGKTEDATSEEQVRADLLDVAILYAKLHVRAGITDAPTAHKQALAILAQAEGACGPSGVLLREQSEHARAAGMVTEADALAHQAAEFPARSAWEHYALGRACAQARDWRQAVLHYDQALAMEPQALWPQFARGLALFQLGEYAEARLSFSICVALAPTDAACVYNRGRTALELRQFDRAISDFDRTARLAPPLAPLAALSRADLYRRQGRFNQALAELNHARGVAPAIVSYHAALVHLDRQDMEAAEASLRETLQLDPAHPQARQLLERLRLTP